EAVYVDAVTGRCLPVCARSVPHLEHHGRGFGVRLVDGVRHRGNVSWRRHGQIHSHVGHWWCFRPRNADTSRAAIVKMNTIPISVSAAPQARAWGPGNTWLAFLKICNGNAALSPWNRLVFVS